MLHVRMHEMKQENNRIALFALLSEARKLNIFQTYVRREQINGIEPANEIENKENTQHLSYTLVC